MLNRIELILPDDQERSRHLCDHRAEDLHFLGRHFDRGVIAAWMNFYVLAQRSDAARRLLRIYHARLLSNLAHALRPLTGDQARSIALRLSAQIDGIYLRAALNPTGASPEEAAAQVLATLKRELAF